MGPLSGATAVARARADVGQSFYPQGYCLEHNYIWWGSVPSTGPGSGHYNTAMDAWNWATGLHIGDDNPPAGVPVYFGISPTRTDRNKAAGDIGLSIGDGLGIFTDANGAAVGIMTLAQRAAQTQRPYLGWSETFLGHQIDYVTVIETSALISTPITDTPVPEEDMPLNDADKLAIATIVTQQIEAQLAGSGFQVAVTRVLPAALSDALDKVTVPYTPTKTSTAQSSLRDLFKDLRNKIIPPTQ